MADETKKSSNNEKLTAGEAFKLFLWNPETKQFLGRSGTSWVKVLVFYVIFYIFLAAFWALMLFIFYQTIDPHRPKWTLAESRIGTNPGLGFRPLPPDERIESTLIWFTTGAGGNYKHYVDDLEKFLKPYTQDTGDSVGKGENVATADECRGGQQPRDGKFCPFDYKTLFRDTREVCNANNEFGFKQGTPCMLLKLNKIFDWKPEPYDQWPAGIPPHNGTQGEVLITCEGENPADKENVGVIRYTPKQSIPRNYYPYQNQAGYQSPFVMVHFTNPARGVLINVECKAWAKNIRYDKQEREGSVHFELLID